MYRPFPRSLIHLPLILVPLVLLAPVWLAGRVMFWGTPFLQFVPWRWEAWEMLKAGQLPLWNPAVGMGAPLAANYQSALFYPPNWLQFLLAGLGGIGWLAWGQAVLVALHLAWAGLGTARLARQLGLGELAQVISGLAFSLSGYLVARSGFLSINSAAAWVPWILLFIARLGGDPTAGMRKGKVILLYFLEHQKRGDWIKLALALAMQLLAGHAQSTWYTLLLAGLWAGFLGWNRPASITIYGRLKGTLAAWWALACALLFALLLTSVQLIPTAEYLFQSQRSAAVGFDFAMTYSFWPWRFLTLLAPDLFGNPAHGDFLGYGNFWEDAVYIGLLPILLALGVMLSLVLRSIRRLTHRILVQEPCQSFILFWSLITLLSFIFALGNHTPVFPWLYLHIPTFDMFQGPTRFTLWAELGLALLAGFGIQSWMRPTGRRLYWTRLGTMGALAVTLGAGLAGAFLGGIRPAFLRATALAGLWGLGAGILSLIAPLPPLDRVGEGGGAPAQAFKSGQLTRIWPWMILLFVSADLLVAGWGLVPGAGPEIYTQPSRTNEELATLGRFYLPPEAEYQIKFDRFFSFKSFQSDSTWGELRAAWLPDAFMLEGLESANNFDPLVPGRYAAWIEALQKANPQVQEKMLNLMGVGVVVKMDPSSETGKRLQIKPQSKRWRWVPCARLVSNSEEALSNVMSGSLNPVYQTVIEENADSQGPICSIDGSASRATPVQPEWISENPTSLDLHIKAETPGWLVLSDVWYPGWTVELDGEAVPLRRADFLFRGVAVPAGDHHISFLYRPVSFYLGALISLVTWGGFLFYLVQFRWLPQRLRNFGWASS